MISDGGFIVTNNHVIEGHGRDPEIEFRRRPPSQPRSWAPTNRPISRAAGRYRTMPFVGFSNSDDARVVAIGCWRSATRWGQGFSTPTGIVSARGRGIFHRHL